MKSCPSISRLGRDERTNGACCNGTLGEERSQYGLRGMSGDAIGIITGIRFLR